MRERARAKRGVRRKQFLASDEVFVGARSLGGPLAYWDVEERQLARIESDVDPDLFTALIGGVLHRPSEAWTISDRDGDVFSIGRYDAADDPSFKVVSPDGEHLGTFLCEDGIFRDEILVRDDATAPVAEVETRRGLRELREKDGSSIAACKRVLDRVGDDPLQEVWWLKVGDERDVLDPRVVLALPLVCALTSAAKRRVDPNGTIAQVLLIAVPPAGVALLLLEAAIDGWYWLRRQLE